MVVEVDADWVGENVVASVIASVATCDVLNFSSQPGLNSRRFSPWRNGCFTLKGKATLQLFFKAEAQAPTYSRQQYMSVRWEMKPSSLQYMALMV